GVRDSSRCHRGRRSLRRASQDFIHRFSQISQIEHLALEIRVNLRNRGQSFRNSGQETGPRRKEHLVPATDGPEIVGKRETGRAWRSFAGQVASAVRAWRNLSQLYRRDRDLWMATCQKTAPFASINMKSFQKMYFVPENARTTV